MGDSVSCNGTTNDADGDTLSYTYQWYANGANIAGATNASYTVLPAQAHATDLKCIKTASDANGGSIIGTSAATSVVNTAPIAFAPIVSPSSPVIGTLVSCNGTTTDADGDNITYTYQWSANGADILGATSQTYIVSQTEKHTTTLHCTAVASDSNGGSSINISANITVANTAPATPTNAAITPVTAYANTTLTCGYTPGTDADGDALTPIFAWYKGGSLISNQTGSTLASAFVKGDAITCAVKMNDGTVDSALSTASASVTISNTAPTGTPSCTFTSGTNGITFSGSGKAAYAYKNSNSTVTLSCSGVTDSTDGDSIQYVIASASGTCPAEIVQNAQFATTLTTSALNIDGTCTLSIKGTDGTDTTSADSGNLSIFTYNFSTGSLTATNSTCTLNASGSASLTNGTPNAGTWTTDFSGTGVGSLSSASSNISDGTSITIDPAVFTGTQTGGFGWKATTATFNNASATLSTSLPTVSTNAITIESGIPTAMQSGLQGSCASQACAQTPSGLSGGIAASGRHTCAITTSGGVKCWGYNNMGQLGNGNTTSQTTPVDVSGLSGITITAITVNPYANTPNNILANYYHSCALTSVGGVKCWGLNSAGQLGNGNNTFQTTPVDVSGLTSNAATAVSAGHLTTCALTTNGGVKCWGKNNTNQLGNNSTTDSTTPVDVSGLSSGVKAISAGVSYGCAVTTSGSVKCWGLNSYGQLGNNSTTNAATPVDVTNLSSGAVAVSAGTDHTCALTTNGGVKCWGTNTNGQLGNNSATNSFVPVDVSGMTSGIAAIAVSGSHSCAITTTGTVKCWGYNRYGQLGNGSYTDSSVPVSATGLSSPAMAISASGTSTCILNQAGAAQCWGSNYNGNFGNGVTEKQFLTPYQVTPTTLTNSVASYDAGETFGCAVNTAGGVVCWGNNGFGQLGDSTTTSSNIPVTVYNLTSGIASVSAGSGGGINAHACALTISGGVKCWGYNYYGELGNNSNTDSPVPVDVTNLTSGVASVVAGNDFTCAITTGGALKCWGDNSQGNLGDNTMTNRSTPVSVTGLSSGVASVLPSLVSTCALTTGGAVKCWGKNDMGQIGIGSTTTNYTTPQSVSNLSSGVSALVGGSTFYCALTTGGSVKCWGSNSYGQLGDNTTTNRNTPVDVNGLSSGVTGIFAGNSHACAILASGVKCWGYNNGGQLGNNTTTNSSTPVDVVGLSNGIASGSAGLDYSCVLTTDHNLKCWGNNNQYQLGMVVHSTPVSVDSSLTPAVQQCKVVRFY